MGARVEARQATKDFEIVPATREIIDAAFDSPLPDFEDNIQFYSAKAMQVDYLITRNKKDFVQNELPVVTPEEFLRVISVLN